MANEDVVCSSPSEPPCPANPWLPSRAGGDCAARVQLCGTTPIPASSGEIGGVWSSYWYNNFIYETNITEGLNIFQWTEEKGEPIMLGHLNPQTQEFTISDGQQDGDGDDGQQGDGDGNGDGDG